MRRDNVLQEATFYFPDGGSSITIAQTTNSMPPGSARGGAAPYGGGTCWVRLAGRAIDNGDPWVGAWWREHMNWSDLVVHALSQTDTELEQLTMGDDPWLVREVATSSAAPEATWSGSTKPIA